MHEAAAHSLLFALVNHASGLVSGRDGGLAGRRVPNNEDATRAAAANLVAARFTPGSYWVWQYKDHLGATSSYERYTVRAARDARLEIELATKFAANESYSAHHVMELDVGDALESRRVGRDGWALALVIAREKRHLRDDERIRSPSYQHWNRTEIATTHFAEHVPVHVL